MYNIVPTGKFKKDLKTVIKRGYDIRLIDCVVMKLANGETLEPKYKDHPLSGNYIGKRECHITPDWLLVKAPVPRPTPDFEPKCPELADTLSKKQTDFPLKIEMGVKPF